MKLLFATLGIITAPALIEALPAGDFETLTGLTLITAITAGLGYGIRQLTK